ncbi:FMN-binding protein [Haloimpatiens sp. FM7330]|uniref:FMN-binding protein n=1 Tax=Haloimpatiens sp. FM7330 TaxID=3298610 RepID=UPI0036278B68
MKIVKISLITIFIIGAFMLSNRKIIMYKEGIYEGIGQGHHGDIKVSVDIDKYKIKEIKIIEQQETPELCDIVYDKIPKMVVKANSVKVDVVAGASYTSQGLIDAIEDAVGKAKIKQDKE